MKKMLSNSTPKSLKALSKGQALTEEQKLAKMVKKLEILENKQREWEETQSKEEDTRVDEEKVVDEEVVKRNTSTIRLQMFRGRLPTAFKNTKSEKKKKDQSALKPSNTTSTSSSHDERTENAKALINAEDIKRIYLSEGWEGLTEVRIKLVVTAISLHNPPGIFKDKFVRLARIAKLGVVHTAVQIGPIILEWNDSSILIPCETNQWASSKVLLALDMKTLTLENFFKNFIGPVSEVIATWNGTYMYNEYTNNCQLFTEEVLKALNIENVFTGKIKKFLDSISTADTMDLVFKHKFDNDPREYEFRTHAELDEVCHQKLIASNTESEDYRLLKAYDRVFWLRHHGVSVSENLKDKALQKDLINRFKSASTCFFGDPAVSNTRYAKTPQMDKDILQLTLSMTQLQYKN